MWTHHCWTHYPQFTVADLGRSQFQVRNNQFFLKSLIVQTPIGAYVYITAGNN